jgi:hypothetical protein
MHDQNKAARVPTNFIVLTIFFEKFNATETWIMVKIKMMFAQRLLITSITTETTRK